MMTAAIYVRVSTDNQEAEGTSLHEISLLGSLKMVRMSCQEMPEIVIIGIEPLKIGNGMDLSPCIQDKLKKLLTIALREVVL